MRTGSWLAPVVLGAGLCGCGSEGVVSLIGRIDVPILAVRRSTVGADATGGFALVLDLGKYASGPTSVSLGGFALERDATVLLSPLSLSGETFPVSVAPGQSKVIGLMLDESPSTSEADALCAGLVAFRGSVTDTLSSNPTTLTSMAFSPACMGP